MIEQILDPENTSGPGPIGSQNTAGAVEQVAAVVEREKERRSGSGRHPKDCMCAIHGGRKTGGKKPVAAASRPSAPVESGPAVVPLVDPEVIKRSMTQVFDSVDRYVGNRIFRVAGRVYQKAGESQYSELAKQARADVVANDDEKQLVGDLSAAVIAKYERLGQYAPEGLLGLWLVSYGWRVQSTLTKLEAIERRLHAPKVKEAVVEPQSQEQ